MIVADHEEDRTSIDRRVERLAARAREDFQMIDATAVEIDPERASRYLRTGAGPAIWLYIEGRSGGRWYDFSREHIEMLESAMNRWFACYAACYGIEMDPNFSIRDSASVLIDTRSIEDTAALLTGIPDRTNGSIDAAINGQGGTDR